jgi:hypothetical protein
MDAVDFSINSWEAKTSKRDPNDILMSEELIINDFFKLVREATFLDGLSHDEEILMVLKYMNQAFTEKTEDENADLLSRYLGIRV